MSSGAPADYQRELADGVKLLLAQMAALAVLAAAGLWLAGHGDKVPGFLAGVAISAVYCLLVFCRVRRSEALPPAKAVGYMRTGWLVRLAFVVLALAWALKTPAINFAAAVAGLLSLQIVIFFNGFYLVIRRFLGK